MAEFLQILASGLTVGAIYALIGIGFSMIYNTSDIINFAQGEFVMIGGMVTFFALAAGVPLPVAVLLAVTTAVLVHLAEGCPGRLRCAGCPSGLPGPPRRPEETLITRTAMPGPSSWAGGPPTRNCPEGLRA